MNDLQQIPLAAFEAAQARHSHLIYMLIMGWLVSVIVLGIALIGSISYTSDEISEVTSMDVNQDADNYGSAYFANGDLINGSTADNTNN